MTSAFCAVLGIFVLIPHLALAQDYPSRSETPVTDDADLIAPVAEAELAERLTALGQYNNAEIVVVTLHSTSLYTAGDDLDVYARGLMADWSLGDTVNGRGVLLLVFSKDRELRIEVGGGFDSDVQTTAAAIVQDTLVPAFRDENFADGIRDGVAAIAERILVAGDVETGPVSDSMTDAGSQSMPETEAAPAAAVDDGAADEQGGSGVLYWVLGGIAAIVAVVIGANRRAAARLVASPCPASGKTGMTRERVTTVPATEMAEGHSEIRTTCLYCGNVETEAFSIPQCERQRTEKKGDPGPIGADRATKGVRSKGGGASGEW